MGQLTALTLPSTTITLPNGQKITVRGLAFEDLFAIAKDHGPEATMLFTKLMNKEKVEDTDVRVVMTGLLPEVPAMAAMAIALAADDDGPEGRAVARRLSPRIQVELLQAIFLHTIESESELKKFVESIIEMIAQATGVIQVMRLPLSEAGFGVSGNA